MAATKYKRTLSEIDDFFNRMPPAYRDVVESLRRELTDLQIVFVIETLILNPMEPVT